MSSKKGEQLVIPGMERKGPPYENCPKCGGAGWLWWHDLDNLDFSGWEDYNDDNRYLCDWCYFTDEEILGKCEGCGFVLSEERLCEHDYVTFLDDTEDVIENGKNGYYQHFECPNCKKIIKVRRDY